MDLDEREEYDIEVYSQWTLAKTNMAMQLRKCRYEADLTIQQVAEKTCLSEKIIEELELGKRIDWYAIIELAILYKKRFTFYLKDQPPGPRYKFSFPEPSSPSA